MKAACRGRWGRHLVALLGGLTLLGGLALSTTPAGAAASHAQIQGSGSSWAYNAVNQWIADVEPRGLQVVFTSTGSAQGRRDFAYSSSDFAVSDIGYQGKDPLTGEQDISNRKYAYLPIVAGGTAFPYQIKVGGQLVRNLRLSGQTLAKIFTNQIKTWDDPAITADNNGRALPPIPIVPVVHSEGSGSTAQFTKFLDQEYPTIWHTFAGTWTEYFPRKDPQVAQNGSDGVMNFLSAGGSNGAIAYDEYSYALGQNYPVAKIENAGGYFTLPNQYNVAVALTQAIINNDPSSPDYLLQDLRNVYGYNDPRAYPLSSYSYGIIPTDPNDSKMTTAKRQTLVDYLYYSICDGQKEMGPIGYSPLPINLVQGSFDQINKLHDADPAVDITSRDVSTCNNPTFIPGQPTRNYLAEIAPQPPACDQAGQGPCADTGGRPSGLQNPNQGGPSANASSGGPAGSGGAGGKGSASTGPAGSSPAGKGSASKGPVSGAGTSGPGGASGPGGQASSGLTGQTSSSPTPDRTSAMDAPLATIPYRSAGLSRLLGPLSVVLLLLVLLAPPILFLVFSLTPKEDA